MVSMSPVALETRIEEFLESWGKVVIRTQNSLYILRRLGPDDYQLQKVSENGGRFKPLEQKRCFDWHFEAVGPLFRLELFDKTGSKLMHTSPVHMFSVQVVES
nr:hypothetical protein [uncultured archaeon]